MTIDKVEIVGLKAAAREEARRRIAIEAGERFNGTKLENARKRLVGTGKYRDVDVSTQGVPGRPHRIRIHFELGPT